jgi:hypothetical protein
MAQSQIFSAASVFSVLTTCVNFLYCFTFRFLMPVRNSATDIFWLWSLSHLQSIEAMIEEGSHASEGLVQTVRVDSEDEYSHQHPAALAPVM